MRMKNFFIILILIILNLLFLTQIIFEFAFFNLHYMLFIQITIFIVQLIIAFSIIFTRTRLRFWRQAFLFFMIGFLDAIYISFNHLLITQKSDIMLLSLICIIGIIISVLNIHWSGKPAVVKNIPTKKPAKKSLSK